MIVLYLLCVQFKGENPGEVLSGFMIRCMVGVPTLDLALIPGVDLVQVSIYMYSANSCIISGSSYCGNGFILTHMNRIRTTPRI